MRSTIQAQPKESSAMPPVNAPEQSLLPSRAFTDSTIAQPASLPDQQFSAPQVARSGFDLSSVSFDAPAPAVADSAAPAIQTSIEPFRQEAEEKNQIQRQPEEEAEEEEEEPEEEEPADVQMQAEEEVGEEPEEEEEPADVQMQAEESVAEEEEEESEEEPADLQMQAEEEVGEEPEEEEEPADVQMQGEESAAEEEEQDDSDSADLQMQSEETAGSDSEAEDLDVQTKLTIGQPGDRYEQEADHMADRVMKMPDSQIQADEPEETLEEPAEDIQTKPLAASITPLVQRQSEPDAEAEADPDIQAKSDASGGRATDNLESTLADQQGAGSPLPDDVRSYMEPRFGADFSQVRVHTSAAAIQMNKDLKAQAFTRGNDIYYGSGKSPANDALTAHELTHTIQQMGGVQRKASEYSAAKHNKLQTKQALTSSATVSPKIQLKANPEAESAPNVALNQASATPAVTPSISKPPVPAAHVVLETPKVEASAPIAGGAKQAESSNSVASVSSGKQAPGSAQADPDFQAMTGKVKGVAEQQKQHDPAAQKSKEAQDAAESPSNEKESQAQDRHVQELNQQQPGQFDKAAFKTALMEKINAAAPKTLEDADKFKDSNSLGEVKTHLSSQIGDEKKQAAAPIEEKNKQPPDTSGIPEKPVTPIPQTPPTPPPGDVGAGQAIPKPKDASEISLEADSKKLDQQLTQANVTEEQLAKSNEPEFQSALGAKKDAQKKAAEGPQEYRQQEQSTLSQAQNQAQNQAQTQLSAMGLNKVDALLKVVNNQGETKTKDEQERTTVADKINGIYDATKKDVETILNNLDQEVSNKFDTGATNAKKDFETFVAPHMEVYKKRYDGPEGWVRWAADKLLGVPPEVTAFFNEGRQLYVDQMDRVLDDIATHVTNKLNQAKQKVADGKTQIENYVKSLPTHLQQVGQEAAQNIQSKFDELEQNINQKQDALIDSLAQKYNENLEQLDAQLEEMKASNRTWMDAAMDALAGPIKTIMEMKDLLMGVLAKAAGAIDKIIKDPVGFLGNLVSGLKQGFQNFAGNIVEHLKQGLIGWLTGAVSAAGIQMPDNLDAKGIFSLVMQVLGLVYENIRAKAVKKLGEKVVGVLETSFEMFMILKNEGVAGLWQFIQDKIDDLKTTVLDAIQNFVIQNVIQAGITWIISLLNPASAFVKACKMIIDIVMFFIERGSQIAELVNAVLDSVTAIADGAVGSAAKLVETSLSKALPVVISFMASLLGLGGISEKIQEIIEKVRQPIDKAIDWMLGKAIKFAKKIGDSKFGKGIKAGFAKAKDLKDRGLKKFNELKEKGKNKLQDWKDKAGKKLGFEKKKDNDKKPDERTPEQKQKALEKAISEAVEITNNKEASEKEIREKLPAIKSKHDLVSLNLVIESKEKGKETIHFKGKVNPELTSPSITINNEKDDLNLVKLEFGQRLFAKQELIGFGIDAVKADSYIAKWKGSNILHELKPRPRDSFTDISLYSFDAAKSDKSNYSERRSYYGYDNPKKGSEIGLKILAKGLIKTPPLGKLFDSDWHKNHAQYRCIRSGKQPLTFKQVILGHDDNKHGASDHWNVIGHKQTKGENQAWNKDPNNYWGPEDAIASNASGSKSALFRIPAKYFNSNSIWL